MITTALRILLVEDNEADILLTTRSIKKIVKVPVIEVVEDLTAVGEKMKDFVPDVVISDYNLPTCSGLDVLQLVQEKDSNVPFIFLTGTVHDEELAANTILAGASGYILKKHMGHLELKLEPLLKKVVFGMVAHEEVRERLRKNKVAVNQIYEYLDQLKVDNKDQKKNIGKIKETINKFKLEQNDDRKA
jgi:response regulator RpfG family c-di-GMP phosphodiesterase